MIVYRLCKAIYSQDISGKGAEKYGGRWNSEGRAVVYTSESRALAVTELAVHLPLSIIPTDINLVSIEIPDIVAVLLVKTKDLPIHWNQSPYHPSTIKIGDDWIKENNYLILKVPSAVIDGDFNYLINPSHEDFYRVKIKDIAAFNFDGRLFKFSD
jgi:RES domain-containing protein